MIDTHVRTVVQIVLWMLINGLKHKAKIKHHIIRNRDFIKEVNHITKFTLLVIT
jgi:hypothetical protein